MIDNVIDQMVFETLVETVGDDFIGEMVDAFLEEGAQFVSDLNSALAEKDVDKFRRAAHSLKSNAATFGATKLSELAKELEQIARTGQLGGVAVKLEPVSVAFANAEHALKEIQNG
jgi:HPt (histidine-containing phosphotransfer) domain-containing protein